MSGLVPIKIKGIYKTSDGLLPVHMSYLTADAAAALEKVRELIEKRGGLLRLSDCYRSREMQARAHADFQSGRKKAYSPPPGNSLHEGGRAIDIDLAALIHKPSVPAGFTCIDENQVRAVFEAYGWTFIVPSGNPHLVDTKEAWHIEFRGEFQRVYDLKLAETNGTRIGRQRAYQAMVRAAIAALGKESDGSSD